MKTIFVFILFRIIIGCEEFYKQCQEVCKGGSWCFSYECEPISCEKETYASGDYRLAYLDQEYDTPDGWEVLGQETIRTQPLHSSYLPTIIEIEDEDEEIFYEGLNLYLIIIKIKNISFFSKWLGEH